MHLYRCPVHASWQTRSSTRNTLLEQPPAVRCREHVSFLVGYRQRQDLERNWMRPTSAASSETVRRLLHRLTALFGLGAILHDVEPERRLHSARERFQSPPYFSIKNLTDRIYIASRAPQGYNLGGGTPLII